MAHTRIVRKTGKNPEKKNMFNSSANVLLRALNSGCQSGVERALILQLASQSAKGLAIIRKAIKLAKFSLQELQYYERTLQEDASQAKFISTTEEPFTLELCSKCIANERDLLHELKAAIIHANLNKQVVGDYSQIVWQVIKALHDSRKWREKFLNIIHHAPNGPDIIKSVIVKLDDSISSLNDKIDHLNSTPVNSLYASHTQIAEQKAKYMQQIKSKSRWKKEIIQSLEQQQKPAEGAIATPIRSHTRMKI